VDLALIQAAGAVKLRGTLVHPFPAQTARPGHMYLVPRGEPSAWAWDGRCELLHLCLAPTLLAAVAAETLEIDPARIELVPRICLYDPLIYGIGLALLGAMHDEGGGGRGERGGAGRLYVESLEHTLAVHLLRHHAVFPVLPGHAPERQGGLPPPELARVVEYIHAHLVDDLTLAELAVVVHRSPYHFARMFRQSTGRSVHLYVIDRRLDEAKRLLAEPDLSIAAVAARTGFADQSHLTRHFKRCVGMSPGAFAKQRKSVQYRSTNLQDPSL
jgi:AraC family transcriptional regulator